MKKYYNKFFYETHYKDTHVSAQKIVPFIYEIIRPQSVIDIGCGVAPWLYEFKKQGGVNIKIKGVDGEYVDKEQLFINIEEFEAYDLTNRYTTNERYDIAMSLEVAEHLPPDRAKSFIEDLTKLSDIVVFSAALPYQGGTNHINEQPISYWISLFENFGYIPYDIIRPSFWNDSQVTVHYKNNIMIFCKKNVDCNDKLKKVEKPVIYDIVHPDMFKNQIRRYRKFMDSTIIHWFISIYEHLLFIKHK